jgi:hypothetical protein
MVIKYTKIFHSKAFKGMPRLIFLVLDKMYHLATLRRHWTAAEDGMLFQRHLDLDPFTHTTWLLLP